MNLKRGMGKYALIGSIFTIFLLQAGVARAENVANNLQDNVRQNEETSIDIGATRQEANISLEQAINIAKEAFPVPESMDRFTTEFSQSAEEKAFWELRWYSTGTTGGSMNVRVNAETGGIWSMHRWTPILPGQEYRGLPRYKREQLVDTAKALAKKLQPERFKTTRLQQDREEDYFVPLYQQRGRIDYRYQFVRIINGITYPESGISVTIDGNTGEVTNYSLNWEDSKDFPPAAGRITLAQAEQVFRNEACPELQYFRPPIQGGKEVPLKLVYRLPGPRDQVLIDALTGALLSLEDVYKYYDLAGGGGEAQAADLRGAEEIKLTPVEEVAVEEARHLLSKNKALEKAKSFVTVPADYELTSSRLEQDYMFKDQKTWRFNWENDTGKYRQWMSVAVDASTGELVYFNIDEAKRYDHSNPPEVNFSEEAAREIAEKYINAHQREKGRQLEFESVRTEYWPDAGEKSRPRSYNFNWVRKAKEVKFPGNGFYVQVDSNTGEVTGYRMNWWDVEFPDPQEIISSESAADIFLREAPLEPAYLRLWSADPLASSGDRPNDEVKLVYHMSDKYFSLLDAHTGETLDAGGNPVSDKSDKIKFTDLENHPVKDTVEILARSGIIKGENGKFLPGNAVTQAELIAMLVRSTGQQIEVRNGMADGNEKVPWYRPYYEVAARIGIIKAGETPAPDRPVDRETLARLTVNTLGLNHVARLSGIYALNFQDAGKITGSLKGHVALSVGLELIETATGRFNPEAVVTRAEAATAVLKALSYAKSI